MKERQKKERKNEKNEGRTEKGRKERERKKDIPFAVKASCSSHTLYSFALQQ